jgi:hypothetical protein
MQILKNYGVISLQSMFNVIKKASALRSVPIRRFSHGILPHLHKGLIAETIEVKKSI